MKIIRELLTFKDVDTKLDYHDSLNTDLWDGFELKPIVKDALDKIADKFKDYLDTDLFPVIDIIVTGSNCNYNWTPLSDIDLHLVVDTSNLEDCPVTDEFLIAKKSMWNSGHDIKIKGYTVELYVQDMDDKLAATGIYSLMNDKWVVKPEFKKLDIDNFSVQTKAADIMNQIDDIITNRIDDLDVINAIKDKIRNMRQNGLMLGGEFSVENLTFKALRNNGYFDKMNNYQKDLIDKNLSLESIKK